MKKIYLSLGVWLLCLAASLAQIPSGYYQAAKGKSGEALKTALFKIINGHTNVGYKNLVTVYADADIRPDGKVYDMYSDFTNYTLDDFNSGNSSEGQGLNKEHSFPKSWFGGSVEPMYSDAFHIVPSDAYINNMRSNYPYGETSSPKKTSHNGFSKLGPCSVSGYTGTVFEPNDEYKGDFARIYFYMVTCYEDKIASWYANNKSTAGVTATLDGKTYPGLSTWTLNMMLRWASNDLVSEKETKRNNAVYKHQKNRNPFVDFPGLEQYIWGDKINVPFDPDNYQADDDNTDAPAIPSFSPESGTVEEGTEVTISCSTEGANIVYSLNGGENQSEPAPVVLIVNQTTSITARAEKDGHYSSIAYATYTVNSSSTPSGENIYRRVSSASDLIAGREYLIVNEKNSTALSAQSGNIRSKAAVSITDGVIETEEGTATTPHALTLGGSTGAWTLYDKSEEVYLSLNSRENQLHTSTTASDVSQLWTITISNDETHIYSNFDTGREIRYNSGSPRFACYKGTVLPITLYLRDKVEETPPTVPENPIFSHESGEYEEPFELEIDCETESAVIVYTINEGSEQREPAPVILNVSEDCTVAAYAELEGEKSETVTMTYTFFVDGIQSVRKDIKLQDTIFTIDGRRIENQSSQTLPRGIYLIDGKKVLLK